MVHQYMQYNGQWLTIRVNFMVKYVCVGFGSNGFITKTQSFPMDGHYRTDIISGVGHPRLDSVVPLVLCTVAYNSWDISIVLQVLRDSINPAEKW
jgi:hypothetical protein